MSVTFVNAAAQPVLNQEIVVATIAGPLDNLDAFVSAPAWADGNLYFYVYATVGGVRAKVATSLYQGPKAGRLQWSVGSNPAAAPVHAGGTSYDLVVLAQATQNAFPGAFSPSQPPAIRATFAGVNASDVVADSNTSATVPVGAGEATIVAAAGFNQAADVAAVMTGMPALDFKLYASCGAGSVEVAIAEQTTQGPDLIASVMRNVALPVATSYRLACSLSNPGGAPVNVTASLSTYQNTLPPTGTIPNPATWTQADWYVDWTNGNDASDGKTPATAVKTVMGGVVAKWGTVSPRLPQTTTLHILTSQPVGAEEIVLYPAMLGNSSFRIVGTPQLVANVVLGAVTAKNRAAGTQFAAAGFGGAGIAVGQLVHNTTAGKNSWAFIWQLLAGTASLTQPLAPLVFGVSTVFSPLPAEVDTWAIGDTASVFAPAVLNLIALEPSAGGVSDAALTGPVLWLENVKVPDQSGIVGNSVFAFAFYEQYIVTQGCYFEPYGGLHVPSFQTNLCNCYFNGLESRESFVLGGIVTTFGYVGQVENTLDADVIITTGSGASGEILLGAVNFVGPSGIAFHGGCDARLIDGGYGVFLWGAGGANPLNAQPGATCWRDGTVPSWANHVFVPLQFAGLLTGSGYVGGGVFQDGIALTSANVDLWNGLEDPRTGARFCNQN